MSGIASSLFAGDFLEQFAAKETDEERFKMVYDRLSQRGALPFTERYMMMCGKNAEQSVTFRKEGNKLLALGNDKGAVECYTKSIAAAPYPHSDNVPSVELALAFSNRSVCYMRAQKYKLAIEDIERALKFKYPDVNKRKVLERKVECYKKMRMSVDNVANLLQNIDLKEKVNISTNNASPQSTVETESHVPNLEETGLEKTFGQHKDIPAASDCLEIRYNTKFGRHLVSTRDIKPGDILAVEKPYVSILLRDEYFTHCYNCLRRSDGMIPCQHCPLVMFCSDHCRDTSWREFHEAECPVLHYILHSTQDNEIMHLAFRIFIVAYNQSGGLRGLYNAVHSLDENVSVDKSRIGFDSNGQYNSSDYGPTYHLACHFDHIPTPLVLVFAQTAVMIVNCIEYSTRLLDETSAQGDPEWRAFAGMLMMRHMRIATSNSYRVDECFSMKADFKAGMIKEPFGGGIYNFLSLCNHACWPNASRFFCDGNIKVLFAQQPIKKGEQIFIQYSGDFKKMTKAGRKAFIREAFFFTCHCAACTNDWPLYSELSTENPKMLCIKCHVELQRKNRKRDMVCPVCKSSDSVENLGLKLDAIFTEMSGVASEIYFARGPKMDATNRAATLLQHLLDCVAMPHLAIVDCQELVGKAFYRSVGNYSVL